MNATYFDSRVPNLRLQPLVLTICAVFSVESLTAATFVVPPDREQVQQATAIVIASALNSRTHLREGKFVETVTVMSVEEVLKRSIDGQTFDLHEPGGVYEKHATIILGIPRFKDGDRYLVFLIKTGDVWRVLNLLLGKFTFKTGILGHEVRSATRGKSPDGNLTGGRTMNRTGPRRLSLISYAQPQKASRREKTT